MANKQSLRGRRSQAESARTRARILDRAERLFARKGYRGVTTREVARAASVHHYTVQHHFKSKLGLFEAVLCRWDEAVRRRLAERISTQRDVRLAVKGLLGELFDFLVERRDWVALNVRSMLGEGLPARVETEDRSWARFIDASMPRRRRRGENVDVRLLLITIEGVLHNHVLSGRRYRALFGKDLSNPRFRRRVKKHLEDAILALLQIPDARAGSHAATPDERELGGKT